MSEITSRFSYGRVIDASERVAWRIDDLLPASARLSFERAHLPESLTHLDELEFLSDAAKLKLNHIRGHSYMNLFAFVEEYIIAQTVRHATAEMFADHDAVRALLRFGEEELKHQALFLRYCAKFRESFGSPCTVLGSPATVAEIVLSKSPMAVMLTTLQFELMTQQHFTDSVKDDTKIDPLFVNILKHHWVEEAQHAKIDVLELAKMANEADDRTLAQAFEDHLSVLEAFCGLLSQQVDMDIESLEATGVGLSSGEKDAIRASQGRSYRADFIVMGMQNPLFLETVEGLSPGGASRVRDAAKRLTS